jgi:hypothetical protein
VESPGEIEQRPQDRKQDSQKCDVLLHACF